MTAEGVEPWGEAMAAVRFEMDLHQPDTAQLADLAVLVLEEIWATYRDRESAVIEASGGAFGPGPLRTQFKKVLEAAHQLRLITRT